MSGSFDSKDAARDWVWDQMQEQHVARFPFPPDGRILRELGHPDTPVATTVHSLQVVTDFPGDETDLPLALVVTEQEAHTVGRPPAAPEGIDWDRLDDDRLQEMPVLAELK